MLVIQSPQHPKHLTREKVRLLDEADFINILHLQGNSMVSGSVAEAGWRERGRPERHLKAKLLQGIRFYSLKTKDDGIRSTKSSKKKHYEKTSKTGVDALRKIVIDYHIEGDLENAEMNYRKVLNTSCSDCTILSTL